PLWVFEELLSRFARELSGPTQAERICYGTLISREQYLKDIVEWGFEDPRTIPKDHLQIWTEAIKTPPA
ncbi:MAG: hypothetical protein HY961_06050, partial [Ignavibacteriae bacterium]|nr:hypothetical protein [Ignavibacteriota bacterium]